MYNYLEEMKSDVMEYINNEINLADYEDRDELEQFLNDELFAVDSVTGNASGSYTCSIYKFNMPHSIIDYKCHVITYLKRGLIRPLNLILPSAPIPATYS